MVNEDLKRYLVNELTKARRETRARRANKKNKKNKKKNSSNGAQKSTNASNASIQGRTNSQPSPFEVLFRPTMTSHEDHHHADDRRHHGSVAQRPASPPPSSSAPAQRRPQPTSSQQQLRPHSLASHHTKNSRNTSSNGIASGGGVTVPARDQPSRSSEEKEVRAKIVELGTRFYKLDKNKQRLLLRFSKALQNGPPASAESGLESWLRDYYQDKR
uniref:Uncharacterized protein n=1 Tax=Lotharella globosa TaxID=91324 RepID=A0A7S4DN85_9EUKA